MEIITYFKKFSYVVEERSKLNSVSCTGIIILREFGENFMGNRGWRKSGTLIYVLCRS